VRAKPLLIALAVLSLPGAAAAAPDPVLPPLDRPTPDRWTRRDTAAEVAFGLALVADYLQTRQIARSGLEANPVMGRRGERVNPAIYFPAAMALHVVAARSLPQPWRLAFQGVSIGVEGGIVGRNLGLGWGIGF
jgi:hypothetical protein